MSVLVSDRASILRYTQEGGQEEVASFPHPYKGTEGVGMPPGCPLCPFAVAPDGRIALGGWSPEYQVVIVDPGTGRQRGIERSSPYLRHTDMMRELHESTMKSFEQQAANQNRDDEFLEILDRSMFGAAHKRLVEQIAFDELGRLWVKRSTDYNVPDHRGIDLFSSEEEYVGTIHENMQADQVLDVSQGRILIGRPVGRRLFVISVHPEARLRRD